MADYSQTVGNILNLYGMAKVSRWGVMIWGTDEWGENTEGLQSVVTKVISETQASTTAVSLTAEFYRTEANTITLNDTSYYALS